MTLKPKKNKAVIKGVSLKPFQLIRLSSHIDLELYGEFSRFAQEAIDEKMDRLEQEGNTSQEKIAS